MKRISLCFILGTIVVLTSVAIQSASPGLALFEHGYPRFYQFRQSESTAVSGKISYADWERMFAPFDGIEGKVMDEEVPGRSAALPFFTQFKKEHPEKLVLLHNNGRGRDPRDQIGKYFAGHWLVYNGCKVTTALPENQTESELAVENPKLFHVQMGLNKNSNEDLVICALTTDGKPDWNYAEQVQLETIDPTRKVLRVKRGCYGTKPLSFQAGKTWVAAHVTEGSWGLHSNLLWEYNFSSDCPRDSQGQNCTDVRVAELAKLFAVGGSLADFDGLEFDVLMQTVGEPSQLRGGRGIDTDGDGKVDNGWKDGINRFGLGVYQFLQRLRTEMGDSKIIQADGMTVNHQRAFDQLNGIESEGWPILTDLAINDWSGGLNRHFFWNQNARKPVFNYINHKFRAKGEEKIEVPANINRLVFAVAQITDAVLTYADAPTAENIRQMPVWDELVNGTANQQGWLGKPLGPPVRLASNSPDLFGGKGQLISPDFGTGFSGNGLQFTKQGKELLISPLENKLTPERLKFRINGIKTTGPDLTLFLTVRGEPLAGYPTGFGRAIKVNRVGEDDQKALMSWTNNKPFAASFYFRDITSPTVDLEFEIEGSGKVWISDVTAYAAPDAIYREFEGGLVLVNPAFHDYEFDLAKLLPGKSWRRIQGTAKQDPGTNNGELVGKTVMLMARDGLFLVKNLK